MYFLPICKLYVGYWRFSPYVSDAIGLPKILVLLNEKGNADLQRYYTMVLMLKIHS